MPLETGEPKDCKFALAARTWTTLILMSVFFCRSVAGVGQSSDYRYGFINLPEPFKGQYITQVEGDNAGMLWFVTNNGLHRFDGNNVLTFDMQSSPSLPDINIRLIMADDRQNLWVATRNKLVRFDLRKWTTTIIPFRENDLVSVRDRSVSVLSKGADSIVYAGFANGKLYSIKNDRLSFITRLKLPASNSTGDFLSINTIKEPILGELWLATGKGQIVHIHHKRDSYGPPQYFEPEQAGQAAVDNLFFTKKGDIIFHSEVRGTFLMHPNNGGTSPIGQPPGLFPLKGGGIFLNGLGDNKLLFFSAGIDTGRRGLGVYDTDTGLWENLTSVYPQSFKGTPFRTTKLSNGRILIVTTRGIATVGLRNNPFRTFLSSVESINSVRSILKRTHGPLYVGSYQERFLTIDGTTGQKRPLSANMVEAMLPWNKDTLLTAGNGIPNWYLEKQNRFVSALPTKTSDNHRLNGDLMCFLRENDSLVWVGTTAGLYLVDVYHPRAMGGKPVTAFAMLRQSKVLSMLKVGNYRFFATEEGMYRLETAKGNIERLFDTAGNAFAYACYNCLQLVEGNIWAGTSGYGIVVFDTSGKIKKTITTSEGLASNLVYSLPFSNNHLLAGTSNGLSMIDTRSHNIRNYAAPFYLPSNEFNRSAWAVSGDTVYMGTINGIVGFRVDSLLRPSDQRRPKICFSALANISDDSARYDYTAAYTEHPAFTVPAGIRSFSVALGGDFGDMNGLDILYRLDGTSAWQGMGQQRQITFVGMGPGSYDLQVGVRKSGSSAVDSLLSLPLTVRPAYYQTTWFRGILSLIALLFVWLLVRLREGNIKKEHILRSRIAGDLHDEVGSALTRIYFQADGLAQAKGDGQSALHRIAECSQEALSSMGDMVWSIDSRHDNVAGLVDRMRDHVSRLQAEVGCHCSFTVLGSYDRWPIAQGKRQNVFLIFKEALNNALKYSPDRAMAIDLEFRDAQLALTVMNKVREKQPIPTIGGNGLKNMELRASAIKGTLTVNGTAESFSVSLRLKL